MALQPVILDLDVLTLDITAFAEPFAERSDTACAGIGDPAIDERHHRYRRLLRLHRERPRRHSAKQRDELTAPHSMTSSARASSIGGTSRPSAFAVFKLIASSNMTGCKTGSFAGFSPAKILPT